MINGEDDNSFPYPVFKVKELRFKELKLKKKTKKKKKKRVKTFAKHHVARKKQRGNFHPSPHLTKVFVSIIPHHSKRTIHFDYDYRKI